MSFLGTDWVFIVGPIIILGLIIIGHKAFPKIFEKNPNAAVFLIGILITFLFFLFGNCQNYDLFSFSCKNILSEPKLYTFSLFGGVAFLLITKAL